MAHPPLPPLPRNPPKPSAPATMLELKGHMAEVQKEMKLEEQRRRRADQRECVNYGLSAASIQAVLAVYVLSEYEASAAGALASRLTRAKDSMVVGTNWDKGAEDIFFACSYDEIAAVHTPDCKFAAQAVDAARRFLSERALVGWVQEENVKGVAPSSTDAYRERFRGSQPGEDGMCKPGRGVRKWVRRWRLRWAVRRGQLKRAEPLPPELVGLKAMS